MAARGHLNSQGDSDPKLRGAPPSLAGRPRKTNVTAEVIVMNKHAVALAADSAVTVGDGDSGKIHNTVNKVFTLSKYHPVGVMVYANADHMGIPLETIIKMYRQKLGTNAEPRIKDYATKFNDFLGSTIFSSDKQQAANVRRIWSAVFDSISSDITVNIQAEFVSKGDCGKRRMRQIVAEVAERHLARLDRAAVSPGFERKRPVALVTQYQAQFDSALRESLSFSSNKSLQIQWKKIAGLVLIKEHGYATYSGIVVTGFGEDEIFPQCMATRVHGLAAGIQKLKVWQDTGIAAEGSHSMIIPFAQREMVDRFVDGVDSSYGDYIAGSMARALRELGKAIIDVHLPGTDAEKQTTREEVEKSVGAQLKAFRENAQKWRRVKFVDPILNALINLPKDDLANLAEALVNLTSLKRRVSTERETVGGPIDVAVISKGDGFIWIKRKHYFRPELNPQFLTNYRNASPSEHANGNS